MKKYLNPSRYIYVDISILLCLIYFINSVFISMEVLNEINIIGKVSTQFSETSSYHSDKISEFSYQAFFIDVAWYLFFYILLEVANKLLSLIDIIAKIIGKPINVNIKLLNKYCTLMLLIIGGKFLVFIIASML